MDTKKTKTKQTPKSKTKSTLKTFEKVTSNILSLMGTSATLKINLDDEKDLVMVNIDGGEETGLLIGNRGRTLNSIQILLGLIYKNLSGDWKRILVDVSDWREKENARLTQLALHTAERAKETKVAQNLYNLTASQRRVVHLALSDDQEVVTESQGEGLNRYLVVSPKN